MKSISKQALSSYAACLTTNQNLFSRSAGKCAFIVVTQAVNDVKLAYVAQVEKFVWEEAAHIDVFSTKEFCLVLVEEIKVEDTCVWVILAGDFDADTFAVWCLDDLVEVAITGWTV